MSLFVSMSENSSVGRTHLTEDNIWKGFSCTPCIHGGLTLVLCQKLNFWFSVERSEKTYIHEIQQWKKENPFRTKQETDNFQFLCCISDVLTKPNERETQTTEEDKEKKRGRWLPLLAQQPTHPEHSTCGHSLLLCPAGPGHSILQGSTQEYIRVVGWPTFRTCYRHCLLLYKALEYSSTLMVWM